MGKLKDIGTTHTLRFQEPEWVAKIGTLLERTHKDYNSKNEFMTVLVKLGYEAYIAAERDAKNSGADKLSAGPYADAPETLRDIADTLKEMRGLVTELSLYMTTQFRHIHVNLALSRRMLSAVHNMTLGFAGGKAVPPEKVEDGFFDDLPVRFEEIIAKLEALSDGQW